MKMILKLIFLAGLASARQIAHLLPRGMPLNVVEAADVDASVAIDIYGTLGCEKLFIVASQTPMFHVDFATEKLILVRDSIQVREANVEMKILLSVPVECPFPGSMLIVSVPTDADVSDLVEFAIVSTTPITVPRFSASVASLAATVPNDDKIKAVLTSQFQSTDRVEFFATYLTGEHPSSPIVTRQAHSESGLVAARWIRDQLLEMGFSVSLQEFTRGTQRWNPNIVAEWPLSGYDGSEEVVILGAHYDDRQRDMYDTKMRAPGANDDGSGSTLVLQVAEVISKQQLKFAKKLKLIWFCGEEQGLYGSDAYAKRAKLEGEMIIAMIQADMVGYSHSGVAGLSFIMGATTPALTRAATGIIQNFLPDLPLSNSSACCSDHQSFYEQGFPTIGLVEPGGYRIDPEYHHPGDLVYRAGYSLEQILESAKAAFSVISKLAALQ